MNKKEKHDLKIERQINRVFRNRSKRIDFFTIPKSVAKKRYFLVGLKKTKD